MNGLSTLTWQTQLGTNLVQTICYQSNNFSKFSTRYCQFQVQIAYTRDHSAILYQSPFRYQEMYGKLVNLYYYDNQKFLFYHNKQGHHHDQFLNQIVMDV